ncbi:MAG: mannosyltransferase family protein [Chloroflexota bacterium]
MTRALSSPGWDWSRATARGLDHALVLAIVGSRLAVLLAAVLAETVLTRNPALTSGDGAPILRSLTSWDGWWYLGIVRDGYHAAPLVNGYHDYAFFPLYPLLVRALSFPWPQFAGLVAVVLSNVLFVAALVLLVRLGRVVLGDERASRGAVLLAISPFAAVFSMAYSESLFLVLALAAFLAVERDRRARSGLLLGLAAFTRLQGAVLVLPLWLVLFLRDGRRLRRSQAWLLAGPLAGAVFLGFVAVLTGSAGAYGGAQGAWGRVGAGVSPAGGSIAQAFSPYQAALLVTLLFAVFLLVYLRPDRIPVPYALVPIIYLGLLLSSGLLESVGRHVSSAFPNAWLLAGRRATWFRRGWPVLSMVLLSLVSLQMFRGYFVP